MRSPPQQQEEPALALSPGLCFFARLPVTLRAAMGKPRPSPLQFNCPLALAWSRGRYQVSGSLYFLVFSQILFIVTIFLICKFVLFLKCYRFGRRALARPPLPSPSASVVHLTRAPGARPASPSLGHHALSCMQVVQ